MKLKLLNKIDKLDYIEVSFWSFFKLHILSWLLMYAFSVIFFMVFFMMVIMAEALI